MPFFLDDDRRKCIELTNSALAVGLCRLELCLGLLRDRC